MRDQFARDLPADTAFATLTAEADASPPGANGLLCLPYFSGERTPLHNPQAKGAFFGLNLTHTRGDMYRAAIEGIAAATRHITDTYADAGATPARVMAVGGGTKNRPWLQATSDMTGLDQTLCRVVSGASFGDAFLASLAPWRSRVTFNGRAPSVLTRPRLSGRGAPPLAEQAHALIPLPPRAGARRVRPARCAGA